MYVLLLEWVRCFGVFLCEFVGFLFFIINNENLIWKILDNVKFCYLVLNEVEECFGILCLFEVVLKYCFVIIK